MISSLARSATTLLACLLVVGGASGCSILFRFEPARDAAPGAVLDAAVDGPLDAGNDAESDAEIDAGTDAACDPVTCPVVLPTCLALHDQCPCAESDYYELDPDEHGEQEPFHAYCDMQTAGGGWTLVGRSMADGSNGDFGWGVDRGDVTDMSGPYSLDVLSRGFAATELLVGSHGVGMTWGSNVYRIPLPPDADFPSAYTNATVEVVDGVVVVAGECARPGSSWMLRNVGHTSWPGGFFFRDLIALQPSGLEQWGWNLSGPECERSGGLDDQPGMLFARLRVR